MCFNKKKKILGYHHDTMMCVFDLRNILYDKECINFTVLE